MFNLLLYIRVFLFFYLRQIIHKHFRWAISNSSMCHFDKALGRLEDPDPYSKAQTHSFSAEYIITWNRSQTYIYIYIYVQMDFQDFPRGVSKRKFANITDWDLFISSQKKKRKKKKKAPMTSYDPLSPFLSTSMRERERELFLGAGGRRWCRGANTYHVLSTSTITSFTVIFKTINRVFECSITFLASPLQWPLRQTVPSVVERRPFRRQIQAEPFLFTEEVIWRIEILQVGQCTYPSRDGPSHLVMGQVQLLHMNQPGDAVRYGPHQVVEAHVQHLDLVQKTNIPWQTATQVCVYQYQLLQVICRLGYAFWKAPTKVVVGKDNHTCGHRCYGWWNHRI